MIYLLRFMQTIQKIIDRQNINHNILFSIDSGEYIDKARVRRHLLKTLKGTQYKSLTIHDLRHVHASVLLNNDIDLKTISTHLGHSSIKLQLILISRHLLKIMQNLPMIYMIFSTKFSYFYGQQNKQHFQMYILKMI